MDDFQNLSVQDMFRVATVSAADFRSVSDYLQAKTSQPQPGNGTHSMYQPPGFPLPAVGGPFEPRVLRQVQLLMAALAVCVSGSAPLSLLESPPRFRPNDFDFFTPCSKGDLCVSFLTAASGYRVVKTSTSYEANVIVAKVWWLERDDDVGSINVIQCLSHNPLDTITAFHSTAVMNTWTSAGLWLAHPELTIARRSLTMPFLLPLPHIDTAANERAQFVLGKYHARGFRFLLSPFLSAGVRSG
ncbi:hypothetical protein K438DRAFT_1960042 [Mycena galopus ATCC 62051]|nr:hypothetical protein K438DRAFT_1960042 [Mycena galopus ATCC 62051]